VSKLEPEFMELDRALQQHLDQVTDDIITHGSLK